MIPDEQREALITREEQALRAALPPDVPDDVIGSIAYGTAIIASALALTLDGDPRGADMVLKTDLVGGEDTSPTLYATQIALGLASRAVQAAAAGGRERALADVRQAAAIYSELSHRTIGI